MKFHRGKAFSFRVVTVLAKKEQNAFAILLGSFTFSPIISKDSGSCLSLDLVGVD